MDVLEKRIWYTEKNVTKEVNIRVQTVKTKARAAKIIGTITHYYDKLGVGIVKLKNSLKVGDTVKFSGHKTNFEQMVNEMQLMHNDVTAGKKGQEVGIKVTEKVRDGDKVELAKE